MKKQMKSMVIGAACAIVVAATGCGKQEVDNNSNDNVAVQFTNSSITRAAGDAWDAGDKIGVYMVANGAALSSASAKNIEYTVAAAGTSGDFSSTTPIYFPVDGSAVDFYAYYPKATITTEVYAVDVTTQSTPKNIDLLWTKAINKTKAAPSVALGFAHQLSKITLNITAGTGMGSLAGMTATITGMKPTANFNLADGIFTATGSVAPIALRTVTDGAAYDGIIVPTTAPAGATIAFVVNGETFVWNISGKTYAAGTNTTYDVTVNRTGVVLNGATITDWTPVNGGSGSAE